MNSWLVLLLVILTFGYFGVYWMYRTARQINKLTRDLPIPFFWVHILVGLLIVDVAWAVALNMYLTGLSVPARTQLIDLHGYFDILYGIYSVFLAFKFRNSLMKIMETTSPDVEGRFNAAATFFFGILYVQFRLASRVKAVQAAADARSEAEHTSANGAVDS